MTNSQARDSGRNVLIAKRPMKSVGPAVEMSETAGFMKFLANIAGDIAIDLSAPTPVDPVKLARRIHRGEWVVDLRPRRKFNVKHLNGTTSIPLHELLDRLDDVPDGALHVHCQTGLRAAIAAPLLARAGNTSCSSKTTSTTLPTRVSDSAHPADISYRQTTPTPRWAACPAPPQPSVTGRRCRNPGSASLGGKEALRPGLRTSWCAHGAGTQLKCPDRHESKHNSRTFFKTACAAGITRANQVQIWVLRGPRLVGKFTGLISHLLTRQCSSDLAQQMPQQARCGLSFTSRRTPLSRDAAGPLVTRRTITAGSSCPSLNTPIYLHAGLALKEQALALTTLFDVTPGRCTPPDTVRAFLEALPKLKMQVRFPKQHTETTHPHTVSKHL
jgi:rhodanese-related sulfurtransferase